MTSSQHFRDTQGWLEWILSPRGGGPSSASTRTYTDALEASLAQTEQSLAEANAENAGLKEDLQSARLALKETTGWSERLPAALQELASLAAGDLAGEYAEQELAEAVLELAGEHLLASVDIKRGDPAGESRANAAQRARKADPYKRARGHPRSGLHLAAGHRSGPGHSRGRGIPGTAVVCSLAGVEGHAPSATRSPSSATRIPRQASRPAPAPEQPAAIVNVTVDGQSAIEYRELYGRMAWSAGLAQSAGILDRLARGHGGQAYQAADREFRLLVDADQAEQACELAEEALADQDGLIFRLSIAQR